jgi:hypothetical protein
MKKVLLLGIFLLSQSILIAQSKIEERAEKRVSMIDEVLEIKSKDKENDLKELFVTYFEAKQAINKKIRQKYPDKEDRKANRDKIKDEFGDDIKEANQAKESGLKSILSDAQYEKWKEYRKGKKEKGEKDDEDDDEELGVLDLDNKD